MSLPFPYWQSADGRHVIYCADCLTVLPYLSPRASSGLINEGEAAMRNSGGLNFTVDAVVTDPPYGIAYEASRYRGARFTGIITGDDVAFDPKHLLDLDVPLILWGGNNFAHRLPKGGWLCWDKRCCEEADKVFGSPFELAWIDDCSKFKMCRVPHGAYLNADGAGQVRVHPTQKPIAVMVWCLGFVDGETILDPYCGSGTTGVACIRTGRRFIGVEIEPRYAAIAVERMERELSQPCLPTMEPERAKQEALL
jgi:site-specific DNA-methyltransferase (adenine-specific)/modification methylase